MGDVLNEGYRKARKVHRCDGWYWVSDFQCDVEDLKPCQGIAKGDEYYFQVNTYDGIDTFKCCIQCFEQAKQNNIPLNDDSQGFYR